MTKMISPAPKGWRGRGWIPGVHRGTDFGWMDADPDGTKRVVSAAAGTVVHESVGGGWNDGWGNQYIIDHGFGIYTTYNHFRTGTMQVDVGDVLPAGTYLGEMGQTGNADGDHLHFEVRINGTGGGNRVDPGPWLDGTQEIPGGSDPISGTQRQVRSDGEARRRIGAPNTSAPQGDPLPANDVGNFKGWVYGESVDGNNFWYVGTSGDFFWSGSFTEISTHDLKDMNAATIGPTQRQVRADGTARQRREPQTSSEMVSEIAASAIATFDGWIHGEKVDGNDAWFREASSKLFSWSGGFTDVGTHDLADLNPATPPAPGPTTRTVAASDAVNVRATPYTSAAAVTQLPAGSTVEVAGWTAGERVSGQGIWYKVDQGWAWSGGFTSQSTEGLAKLPAPTPPSGGINTDFKSFTPDSALATWIGSPNFNWRTPRPAGAAPTHVTMHWMDGTLAGTDAQFQKYESVSADGRGDGSASNYGVGQSAIHQYVREQDYQQADGDQNSNRWGLSIEHEGSTSSPVTQAVMNLSASLLAEIAKRYGWTEFVPYTDDPSAFRALPDATQLSYVTSFAAQNPTRRLVFPHKAWVATSCPGALDWQAVVRLANALLASPPDPDPEDIVVTREFVAAQVAAAEALAATWKGLLT